MTVITPMQHKLQSRARGKNFDCIDINLQTSNILVFPTESHEQRQSTLDTVQVVDLKAADYASLQQITVNWCLGFRWVFAL